MFPPAAQTGQVHHARCEPECGACEPVVASTTQRMDRRCEAGKEGIAGELGGMSGSEVERGAEGANDARDFFFVRFGFNRFDLNQTRRHLLHGGGSGTRLGKGEVAAIAVFLGKTGDPPRRTHRRRQHGRNQGDAARRPVFPCFGCFASPLAFFVASPRNPYNF